MQLSSLMAILQRGDVPKRELFMVTTGDGTHPAGLSVLDALCMGQGVREYEDHFGLWRAICGMVVKFGSQMGMLDNMSGSRGDTPLMKAAANGNLYMVQLLLKQNVRGSHLGLITPPIWSVSFYLSSLRKGFLLGRVGGWGAWWMTWRGTCVVDVGRRGGGW